MILGIDHRPIGVGGREVRRGIGEDPRLAYTGGRKVGDHDLLCDGIGEVDPVPLSVDRRAIGDRDPAWPGGAGDPFFTVIGDSRLPLATGSARAIMPFAAASVPVLILDADPVQLLMDQGAPLGLVVNELVTNAVKHAFNGSGKGTINVTLRAHGLVAVTGEEVQTLPAPGLNYRLPELGAAIGRVQLRRLPTLLALHRERAERYRARLGAAGLQLQADTPGRVWQTLAVVLPDGVDRPQLRAGLLAAGIETQIASYGLHRLAAYKDAPVFSPDGTGTLAVTERLHHQGLALPLHGEMSLADVDRVCEALLARLPPRAGA